jgi:septal ring factor EnvC (AmiA/AmiB activator)
MAGIDHTPHMQELEEQLKNLLKRQGKINTDLKAINKEKAKLRDEIVNAMDEEGGKQKQEGSCRARHLCDGSGQYVRHGKKVSQR